MADFCQSSLDTLQACIRAAASRNDSNDKNLALSHAALSGSVPAVRALIDYGANPNTKYSGKTMPIDARNHKQIDQTLIDCQRKNGLLITVQSPPREIKSAARLTFGRPGSVVMSKDNALHRRI